MAISAIGDISDHVRRSLEYMTYVRGHSRYILASTSFYTVVLLQQYAQRVLATSSQYIHLFTSKYTKNSQRIFNNIITVCVLLSYAYYELVEYYQLRSTLLCILDAQSMAQYQLVVVVLYYAYYYHQQEQYVVYSMHMHTHTNLPLLLQLVSILQYYYQLVCILLRGFMHMHI